MVKAKLTFRRIVLNSLHTATFWSMKIIPAQVISPISTGFVPFGTTPHSPALLKAAKWAVLQLMFGGLYLKLWDICPIATAI
jgi:hypothetical protein